MEVIPMQLNEDLIRKFATMINVPQEKKPTEVYGTISIENDTISVIVDGNSSPIPIVNDKKYQNNERVKVTIQNNRFVISPIGR